MTNLGPSTRPSTRPHEDRRATLHQIRSQTQLASQQQPSSSKNAGNNGLGRRPKSLLCSPEPGWKSSSCVRSIDRRYDNIEGTTC